MPYLIFALIPVAGGLPVILALVIVAIAPSRADAVTAVLREGRTTSDVTYSLRRKGASMNAVAGRASPLEAKRDAGGEQQL
jgi:hypothetical protein